MNSGFGGSCSCLLLPSRYADSSYSASDLNGLTTQAPALVLFPTVDAAPGATVRQCLGGEPPPLFPS